MVIFCLFGDEGNMCNTLTGKNVATTLLLEKRNAYMYTCHRDVCSC